MQKAKRLKPDKWRAAFDSEGKLIGFQKLLKLIKSGVSSFLLSGFVSMMLCTVFNLTVRKIIGLQ